MANFCLQQIANTGEDSCRVLILKAKGYILVPYINSSGVTPALDPATDIVNNAFVEAKINNINKLDRWYPINNIRISEDVRADDEFFSYPDGTREFLRQGARTVNATRGSGTPQFVKNIKTWGKFNAGFYAIDEEGKLIGNINKQGLLEPFQIEDNTFTAKLVTGNDTQKFSTVVMTFDYSNLVSDGDMGVWLPESDVNILTKDGVSDLGVKKGASTATTLGLTVDTGSGYVNSKVPFMGGVISEFSMQNLTTTSPVALTTVVEPSDGNYVLTFPAQTLADVVEVTITRAGYETSVTTHIL